MLCSVCHSGYHAAVTVLLVAIKSYSHNNVTNVWTESANYFPIAIYLLYFRHVMFLSAILANY